MSLFFKPKMVRLHLKNEAPSVEGILTSRPNGFYKLAKPELLSAERENMALDGEVWIPEKEVLLMQVLTT